MARSRAVRSFQNERGSYSPATHRDMRAAAAGVSPPLVIDLDGTLLRADLMVEGIFAILRRNILMLLPMLIWLLRGRSAFKRKIAERSGLDVAHLPANAELLAFIEAEKARGREIVLATAADQLMAARVAQRFGIFDRILASDGRTNLKGAEKARTLAALFPQGFLYAGDSHADLPVWKAASGAILVEVSPSLARRARNVASEVQVFPAASRIRALGKGLRLHQWVKNALVFLPLVLGGKAGDAAAWLQAGFAFVALGLVASATYLINDLWDLPHDRAHWTKRERPLASGRLPVSTALVAILLGLGGGLAIGASVGPPLFAGLLAYLILTLAYSLSLKRAPMVDVMTLGTLFTLRLVIGVAAVGVAWSPWLLTFSMFLFTSLSFAKRHVELRGAAKADKSGQISGRGYRTGDEPVVLGFGVAAGIASIVIFIIYLSQEAFRYAALASPLTLWVFPPVLALFMGRIWLLAGREELHDDPVAFAVRDRASLALGAVAGFAFLLAATGLPLQGL